MQGQSISFYDKNDESFANVKLSHNKLNFLDSLTKDLDYSYSVTAF